MSLVRHLKFQVSEMLLQYDARSCITARFSHRQRRLKYYRKSLLKHSVNLDLSTSTAYGLYPVNGGFVCVSESRA